MADSFPDRFSTEPIIGWRYWYAVRDAKGNAYLRSPVVVHKWPARKKVSYVCMNHQGAPRLNCKCGIHAHKTRNFKSAPSSRIILTVIGQVSLWGRVLEHEDGWRAQYAYPYSLEVQPFFLMGAIDKRDAERMARDLITAYGVETTVGLTRGHR